MSGRLYRQPDESASREKEREREKFERDRSTMSTIALNKVATTVTMLNASRTSARKLYWTEVGKEHRRETQHSK